MGMFDYVEIEKEVEIPVPDNFIFNIHDFEFQTKSFDRTMSTYVISNDKCIYRKDWASESLPTKNQKIEKINFHGLLDFYTYHATDLIDYILDYQAKFTDGHLEKIILIKYESYEHESTKVKLERIKEKIKKENNSLLRKLFLFIGNATLVYPFRALGVKVNHYQPSVFRYNDNFIFRVCLPNFIIGYKKDKTISTYGFSFEKIETGIYYKKKPYTTEFSFKLLGFGFEFIHFFNKC